MKTQAQLLAHTITAADWDRIPVRTRAALLRSQKRADFVGRRVRTVLTSMPHKTAQTFLLALTSAEQFVGSAAGRLKSTKARDATRDKNGGVGLRAYHRFLIPENGGSGAQDKAKKAAEAARKKALAAVRAKGRVKVVHSPFGYYALYADWDVATKKEALASAARLRSMGFEAMTDARPIATRARASGGPGRRYVPSDGYID